MKFIKQVSFLIVLAAMVLFTPLDSSAQYFYNGNELVQKMRESEKQERDDPSTDYFSSGFYMGYVAGVYEAMRAFFVAPENVTVAQVCSIVGKYLKENPEKWTLPASVLVMEALQKAFPKK
jgi:hypothetical protein